MTTTIKADQPEGIRLPNLSAEQYVSTFSFPPDDFATYVSTCSRNPLDAHPRFISQSQLLDTSYPTVDLLVFITNIALLFEDLPISRDISYQLTKRPLLSIAVFLAASVTSKSKVSLGNPLVGRISVMSMRKEYTRITTES